MGYLGMVCRRLWLCFGVGGASSVGEVGRRRCGEVARRELREVGFQELDAGMKHFHSIGAGCKGGDHW